MKMKSEGSSFFTSLILFFLIVVFWIIFVIPWKTNNLNSGHYIHCHRAKLYSEPTCSIETLMYDGSQNPYSARTKSYDNLQDHLEIRQVFNAVNVLEKGYYLYTLEKGKEDFIGFTPYPNDIHKLQVFLNSHSDQTDLPKIRLYSKTDARKWEECKDEIKFNCLN